MTASSVRVSAGMSAAVLIVAPVGQAIRSMRIPAIALPMPLEALVQTGDSEMR